MSRQSTVYVQQSAGAGTNKSSCLGCLGTFVTIALFALRFIPDHGSHDRKTVGLPAVDQAYFDAIGKQVADSGPTMQTLSDLYNEAEVDPVLLKSPDWQKRAKAACAALDLQGKSIQNIAAVPDDCLEISKDSGRAGKEMQNVAKIFLIGADTDQPDMDVVGQAVQANDTVVKYSKVIADDANKIRVKYGLKPITGDNSDKAEQAGKPSRT